jgi:hypothetical protein
MPFVSIVSPDATEALIRVFMSTTIGDVIMRDGSRLEHKGVVPDQVLQPTATALKMKYDAVLSYAAVNFGATLSPEDAGKFYFIAEKEENSGDNAGDDKK